MHLEEAMKHEVYRLEKEIQTIDDALEKFHNKIAELLVIRKKKEHDLRAIRASFGEPYVTEAEETLENILKEKSAVKI